MLQLVHSLTDQLILQITTTDSHQSIAGSTTTIGDNDSIVHVSAVNSSETTIFNTSSFPSFVTVILYEISSPKSYALSFAGVLVVTLVTVK